MPNLLEDLDSLQKRHDALKIKVDNFERAANDATFTTEQPELSLITPKREEMWNAFQAGGWPAVCLWMYEYAQKVHTDPKNKSYKYFLDDRKRLINNDARLPFILCNIYHKVMCNIIPGTLPQLMYEDTTAKDLTNFRSDSGVYINVFHNTGIGERASSQRASPDPEPQSDLNKGFSISDYQTILETIEEYLRVPSSNADNIDNQPGPKWGKVKPGVKRFRENAHQEQVIREWMASIKKFIINNRNLNSNTQVRFNFTPANVGYGDQTGHRALDHTESESTSALFGLVNAVLRYALPGQWTLLQRQISYICGSEYQNLTEAAVSVLASSYTDEGGYNGKRAGALSDRSATNTAFDENCGRNIDLLLLPGATKENPGGRLMTTTTSIEKAEDSIDVLKSYNDNQFKSPIMDLKEEAEKKMDEVFAAQDKLESNMKKFRSAILLSRLKALAKEWREKEDDSEEDGEEEDEDEDGL